MLRHFQKPCSAKVVVHIGQGEKYNDITPQHQTVFNLKKQISSVFSCQKNCLYCWRRDLSKLVTQSKNVFSMEADQNCVRQKATDEGMWFSNGEKIREFCASSRRRRCTPFSNNRIRCRNHQCWWSRTRGSR